MFRENQKEKRSLIGPSFPALSQPGKCGYGAESRLGTSLGSAI